MNAGYSYPAVGISGILLFPMLPFNDAMEQAQKTVCILLKHR
jgi:hypothetical protein